MPVTFNLDQKIASKDFNWQQLWLNYHTNPRRFENFELFVNASNGDDKFILESQYNTDLFKPERVKAWMQLFESLLEDIIKKPQSPLYDFAQAEIHKQQAILQAINSTQRDYSHALGVHELIHAQALKTPDKIAIFFPKAEQYGNDIEQLSYAQLDQQSSQIAHYLLRQGIKPQTPIGLCVERSTQMLVAMIGIWKSGAGYIPLDPNYPPDRLQYMIDNSGMSLIMTETNTAKQLSDCQAKLIYLDQKQEQIAAFPQQPPALKHFNSAQMAYTIYTSGSTGNPKGVMIRHKNVVNFLQSMAIRPGLKAHDKILAVTTISFDIAVLELFLPLIIGAQVFLASRETAIDGEKLIHHIDNDGITCLQATPMTWRLMLASGWQGNLQLKVLCGGEPFPNDLALSLYGKVHSLWNMYGPTETTVWSSCYKITDPHEPIYIGQPIANTQIYILDKDLNLLGPGKTGDLYIGGDGLAIGYLGAEELSQQKFIINPFHTDTQQVSSLNHATSHRIYSTGDLGRYHFNGQLECLGRNDNQIKLRGFRIELGEIQSVIIAHHAVAQCVIKLAEVDGEKSICAYLILHKNTTFTHSEMRQFARQKLPEYMIPSQLMVLTAFPTTLNGKIDSKALPVPSQVNITAEPKSTEQPLAAELFNPAQQLLIKVFKQVLAIDTISVEDNFFELGGHSLLSIKVIQQLKRQCQHNITPRMMLTDNIYQLASQISQLSGETINNHDKSSASLKTKPSEQELPANGFFFGHTAEKKNLFGFYYPAHPAPEKKIAILLLYPIQQEYMRCHWGMKMMAKSLAKQGFPVLKFDYFGTGDSFGDSEQFNLQQCLYDIRAAEQTLKQSSGIESIALIGLRLGASLAAQYAQQHKIKQLYLWEPVIDGSQHLLELTSLQKQLYQRIKENSSCFKRCKHHLQEPPRELLGYPFSQTLYQELQQLNLLKTLDQPALRTILVTSKETPDMRHLKDHLLKNYHNFSYKQIDDAINWTDLDQYLNSIIPHQSMNQIINFLTGGQHE